MADVVLGLDISTSGLGMVAVPTDWDLNWRRVRFYSLEYKLKKTATARDRMDRLRALSLDVRTWAIRVGATKAWAEACPTFGHNIMVLAKLRCAIELELYRETNLILEDAQQSSVRQFLLGRFPPCDRKAAVSEALKVAGDPFEDDDQRDAFAVANWGLSELGAPCFAHLLGTPEEKPKRKRARAA